MKKIKFFALLLALTVTMTSLVTSCGSTSSEQTDSSGSSAEYTEQTAQTTEATTLSDPTDDNSSATGDFSLKDESGNEVTPSGNVYTLTAAGEYTASGSLPDGQIVVNASDDDKVVINLSGAAISCSTGAPILALEASKVEVKAKKDTYNEVTDARSAVSSSDDDDDYNGAIYAKCDLELSGKGTLIVKSSCDNGVKTKDDLEIKNLTLKVTAPGNALKGNDSVTIESGSVILISSGSDGIKTSNSDVSSKGNQRGTVTISGGQVDIYSACDGIDASYDVSISGDAVVNIFTSSYSEYADETSVSSDFYLIVPTSLYSTSYDYYAYLYNNNESSGVWVKFSYSEMVYAYSGRSVTYYYGLTAKLSSGYNNIIFNIVTSGQTPDGITYVASSSGGAINTSKNGYQITSISSKLISGSWQTVGNSSGSSSKTAYSSKGLKAANDIDIAGGTLTIYAMDDGIHANMGEELENGSTGTGNVTVSGGSVTVTSADDGIHADNILTISDGYVNIVNSHEGLEANVINIGGGSVYVYGDDDGLNACSGKVTPLINITGGYVDVTTPSGDTDAIDSNGNITISGGYILVKGGSSSGSVAGSVDVDGTITVTGGAIVALGGICETPSNGSVNTYISSGTSFSAGNYVLKNSSGAEILSFSLSSSYSSVWISSDKLVLNQTYTLSRDGTSVLSWTQSSSTTGSAGNQGGGQGGWGGMGRGR